MLSLLRNSLHEAGSVEFDVKVRPGASRTVAKDMLDNGVYKIDVAAAPEDGKANVELVSFLAKELRVPRMHIELLSGHTSPLKRIRAFL
jgi:uncharacterized protein YggU (UPF0235/DUF167 family)